MKIFEKAFRVMHELELHGYKAYLVGGAVRDYLIGKSVGDLDIATSAKPEQVMNVFDKVIPVGIEHGTVLVRYEKESFEITTFRTEGTYSDYRHPDRVEFVTDITADLARRDYTVNAIAMDRNGQMVDPFSGREAIEKQQLITVGNAYDRFEEDPLRMMRGVRFVSQLGYQLDQEAREVMESKRSWLNRIAIERVAIELEKLCCGDYVKTAVRLLSQAKLWEALPVFKDHPTLIDKLEQRMQPLGGLSEWIALCAIYSGVSVPDWVKHWKLSNSVKQEAQALFYMLQSDLAAWTVYQLPSHLDAGYCRLMAIYQDKDVQADVARIRAKLPIHQRADLAVSGGDFVSWFPDRKKGSWIRELFQAAEKAVVENRIPNDKERLKEWVLHGYDA
ncbi:tRNA nucleotidyltransferase (CCA-adding enzyme) [Terribacillus aidingensis]|uniref:CCA-adding enzyme n=1 Tax=Terribacillus aidingensis TaxID=586416 RepID=A0A285NLK3_9BACI|nr:CCA tRNA nucleotidyltransferase [Terribacillus aidingensis]SNZ10335.1 tRNA nucleotidyltransferase (CCA-adding enzyme) [Terribacillus aidingensis]